MLKIGDIPNDVRSRHPHLVLRGRRGLLLDSDRGQLGSAGGALELHLHPFAKAGLVELVSAGRLHVARAGPRVDAGVCLGGLEAERPQANHAGLCPRIGCACRHAGARLFW